MNAHLVSRVQALRFSAAADTIEVTARAGGQICTIACPLPLVVTTSAQVAGVDMARADNPATIETLPIARLGIDASRLVPRPDLLGALVPAPAENVNEMSLRQASAALLRHR